MSIYNPLFGAKLNKVYLWKFNKKIKKLAEPHLETDVWFEVQFKLFFKIFQLLKRWKKMKKLAEPDLEPDIQFH